jgi:GAF domain-containing protein
VTGTYIPIPPISGCTTTSCPILCVDPDDRAREETADALRAAFEAPGPSIDIVTAGTVAEADAALTTDTAAVITEYTLPDGTGCDVIRAARDTCPDAGCVLYTDTDPDTIDTDELRGSITEYVGKGSAFGADRLTQLIRTTVETRSQTTYPVPQTETERLAALRSYGLDSESDGLDSESDGLDSEGDGLDSEELVSSLERITDVAAAYFDAERASVNIIGEHSQDFLACYGDVTEWEAMDREDSICTFTILEDSGVMTVEDVTKDPRFESRSETLLEMGIHAYIGANLVTPSGLAIGSLCVYDDEPRSFSPADEAYLRDLAAVAMELIELRTDQAATAAADGGSR